jgi:hypothetical protein
VGFSYLNGKSWTEVTRDERFFCQHLFSLIKRDGPAKFLAYVNRQAGVSLPLDAEWEPAYEVCFYRDLRHLRGRTDPLFSPKRTGVGAAAQWQARCPASRPARVSKALW